MNRWRTSTTPRSRFLAATVTTSSVHAFHLATQLAHPFSGPEVRSLPLTQSFPSPKSPRVATVDTPAEPLAIRQRTIATTHTVPRATRSMYHRPLRHGSHYYRLRVSLHLTLPPRGSRFVYLLHVILRLPASSTMPPAPCFQARPLSRSTHMATRMSSAARNHREPGLKHL